MKCTSDSRGTGLTLPPTPETRAINGNADQVMNRGLKRETYIDDVNQTVSELSFFGIHSQGQGGVAAAAAWARYETDPNMTDGLGSLEIHNYALWYVKICNSSECSVWSYTSLHAERTRLSHPLYGRHEATGDLVSELDLRMSKDKIIGTEIEVTLSIILLVIAFGIMLIATRRSRRLQRRRQHDGEKHQTPRHALVCMQCTSLLAQIVAAVCIFIPLERFAEINFKLSSISNHTNCNISTPYSLFLLGGSGMCAILAAIFNVRIIYLRVSRGCIHRNDDDTGDVGETPGQMLVGLVSRESNGSQTIAIGYTDPVRPGYTLVTSEEYPVEQSKP
ncbi:hypothetical protein DPMN_026194 [Dreissena polymorpha]|uniref:Uncharacterized protein n=2 Tax=Dreissena polymorpha TaxID=45954 RepID=A0A9D4LSR8_DREPO|nr:hypothetical protein DPMN_026194 [Dreissena polymorpha]